MCIVYWHEDGGMGIALELGGVNVSRAVVIPRLMRVGEAVVRIDGIGGTETQEVYKDRGYGRRVMEAAVQRMCGGDAAVSILWGIPDYYETFGYSRRGRCIPSS